MIVYFVLLKDEVVYIGQTKYSLEERRKQHERNAELGRGYVIGAGIRKHGKENFVWKVHSAYAASKDMDLAEKFFIQQYRPRYNINEGGEARGLRKPNGRSAWNKGLKGAQRAWNKGRKETRSEVLEKISKSARQRPNRGPLSEAHKIKLSAGRIKAYRDKQRKILCHETQKIYSLVVDAAKDLGISANGIYAVLNPKHSMKCYKGFTFSYVE